MHYLKQISLEIIIMLKGDKQEGREKMTPKYILNNRFSLATSYELSNAVDILIF